LFIPIYVLLILLGWAAFHSGAVTIAGNELSSRRALFTAVNAATLTGFSQPISTSDYTTRGQELALALMIAGMLFSFIAGGIAVVRIARLPYSNLRVIAWSFVLPAIVAGIASLIVVGGGSFDSLFQAISALGNSGLYTGHLPESNGILAFGVLLPLAVVGGLGLPVLMDLTDRATGRRSSLSNHSRTVLSWTCGIYVVSAIVLVLLQLPSSGASWAAWQGALENATRQAINARSAGFAFEFASSWPRIVQWVIMGLMIIGAAPAGTGGGIKVTTLAALSDGTRNALGYRAPNRLFAFAFLWLAIYFAMLLLTLLALLMTEPQLPADRVLFLAISALGNVGLSHEAISLSDGGFYILSVTMLAGRIAPVLMLWWIAQSVPEADVAVG